MSGCNLELFELNECEFLANGNVCANEAISIHEGPAPDFFMPCEGAAYIYSKDDAANSQGGSFNWTCCVGTSCKTVPRQPVYNLTEAAAEDPVPSHGPNTTPTLSNTPAVSTPPSSYGSTTAPDAGTTPATSLTAGSDASVSAPAASSDSPAPFNSNTTPEATNDTTQSPGHDTTSTPGYCSAPMSS